MIKWFCDICGLEILAPEHPVHVSASHSGKNRDDAQYGWGESKDIIKVFCHKTCADTLTTEIELALEDAKRVVKNNG